MSEELICTMWIDPVRQRRLDDLLDRLDVAFSSLWVSDSATQSGPHRVQQYTYSIRGSKRMLDAVDRRLDSDCVNVTKRVRKEV